MVSVQSGFNSVQSLSHVRLFATRWTTAHQASLSITNSRSSPKLMSIELVIPSNHLILCCPLLLLPSIFPSIRIFPMSQLFALGAKILEFQLQHHSFQCHPWGDNESDTTEWLKWTEMILRRQDHYLHVCSFNLCPTLCDPMNFSPPSSSVHGIFLARILEWVAISSSRGSFNPGIELTSPALQKDALPLSYWGSPGRVIT